VCDYFIKNGIVVDGSGSEPIETNIGISGDRIAYIGKNEIPAINVIDAKGLIVSPGFIDTHGHSEFTLLADGRAEGKLLQGITTEINGNCGLSAAPLFGEALQQRESDLKELSIKEGWSGFREYFNILQKRGIAINFATLCGHGNLRASVMGYKDTAPDEKSLNEMKRLLSEAIKQGAKGISTGLIYPPGVYSTTEELIELCLSFVSHHQPLIYASHMRSEGDNLIEAISEVVRIGRESGVNVHISHIKTMGEQNWHKADKAIELMENAGKSGITLTCDRYPYIAASTDLDSVLPSWVYEGGVKEELKRLKDKDAVQKIKAFFEHADDSYWQGIYVSSVEKSINKWMEGNSLFNIALKTGRGHVDTLLDIIIDERTRVGAIFFSMNEDNLIKFLSLPYTMLGSDSSARSYSGPTCKGIPHPRGFGSFPAFIGRYVRDKGIMPLSEAIRKATSLPALTFGLNNRGIFKEGFYADIAVFDYERIIDRATFKEPYTKPEGIIYVFVNGSPVLKEGRLTESLEGRILS